MWFPGSEGCIAMASWFGRMHSCGFLGWRDVQMCFPGMEGYISMVSWLGFDCDFDEFDWILMLWLGF